MKVIASVFLVFYFFVYPVLSFACSPLDVSLAQSFLESRQKLFTEKVITRFELNQAKLTALMFQNCAGKLSGAQFCAKAAPLADEVSQSMKAAMDQGYNPTAPFQKLDLILKIRTQCRAP